MTLSFMREREREPFCFQLQFLIIYLDVKDQWIESIQSNEKVDI